MSEEQPPNVEESTIKSETQLKLVVDLWATDAHKVEVGLYKMERKSHKDRQWTKDADIIGKLEKNGKDYGHITIRKSVWDTDNPLEKRLVLKLFSMSDYWQGSLELLQSESIALSGTTEST